MTNYVLREDDLTNRTDSNNLKSAVWATQYGGTSLRQRSRRTSFSLTYLLRG